MTGKVLITTNASDEALRRARAFCAYQDGSLTDQDLRNMYIRCVQDMIRSREAVSTNASSRDGCDSDLYFCMKSEIGREGVSHIMKFTDASRTDWITKDTWPHNVKSRIS